MPHIKPQLNCCGDLVHVLPTGTTGLHKLKIQLGRIDENVIVNFNHGEICLKKNASNQHNGKNQN